MSKKGATFDKQKEGNYTINNLRAERRKALSMFD